MNEPQTSDVQNVVTGEYRFPCMLTVERAVPLSKGNYKESRFSMEVDGVENVEMKDGILTIEYLEDGLRAIKRIPRENVVEWDVIQFPIINTYPSE